MSSWSAALRMCPARRPAGPRPQRLGARDDRAARAGRHRGRRARPDVRAEPGAAGDARDGRADLALTDSGVRAIEQSASVYESWAPVDDTPRAAPLDLAVPPGSSVVRERQSTGRVGAADRVVQADLHELAYDDPVAAGVYAQVSGRAPDGPR